MRLDKLLLPAIVTGVTATSALGSTDLILPSVVDNTGGGLPLVGFVTNDIKYVGLEFGEQLWGFFACDRASLQTNTRAHEIDEEDKSRCADPIEERGVQDQNAKCQR